MSNAAERTRFSDSLSGSLVVPLAAIRAVGPAAETLATVMQISLGETFVSQKTIAEKARLPVDTVKKHLNKLIPDWLENDGRSATKAGWIRRTVTLRPTATAKKSRASYLLIPWWARCNLNLCDIDRKRKSNRLTWSEKVLLGVVVSRFVGIQTGVDEAHPDAINTDEVYDRERYRFSLRYLEKQTGMDRKTIIRAKYSLYAARLVYWCGDTDGETTDIIAPNFMLEVVEKPSPKSGFVYVSIETKKSLAEGSGIPV